MTIGPISTFLVSPYWANVDVYHYCKIILKNKYEMSGIAYEPSIGTRNFEAPTLSFQHQRDTVYTLSISYVFGTRTFAAPTLSFQHQRNTVYT